MQIAELLSGLKYNSFGVNLRGYVGGAASDSRNVTFGNVFVCLRGTLADGHDFAEDAMRRGAVAVICERYLPGLPCIVVKNTRIANAVIWNNLCGRPASEMTLVAVTGTNGKTSTVAFLSSIMNEGGIPTASLGTLGCFFDGKRIPIGGSEIAEMPASMTTPDPEALYKALQALHNMGAKAVVMEVSSHSIAQYKTAPLSFECGIFTNLSPEHLDFHLGMEEYYKVKASLFKSCRISVICCDGGYGRRLAGEAENVVAVESADASKLICNSRGVSYEYKGYKIKSSVPGLFTVENTMLALSAAEAMGFSKDAIEKGIARVSVVPGRMERVEADNCDLDVFIDYAHTPDALASAIKTVRSFAPNRKLTVLFGCGGNRDKGKRPVMGRIASEYADRVIVTGDNSRNEDRNDIIRDILRGVEHFERVRVIVERKTAVRYAVLTARQGEIVLLCGKGHEDYETDDKGKHPFSEKEIVLSALRAAY